MLRKFDAGVIEGMIEDYIARRAHLPSLCPRQGTCFRSSHHTSALNDDVGCRGLCGISLSQNSPSNPCPPDPKVLSVILSGSQNQLLSIPDGIHD